MENETQDIRKLSAIATADGERLDRYLASMWPDLSRARIQALIGQNQCQVNDKTETSAKRKVRAMDCLCLQIPAPIAAEPQAENIPLDVLFEDEHLIVLVKPAGLTVHPAAGNWTGTLVNALLHHCAGSLSGIGGVERPGIVHRLDKDTSGVLVAAKSDQAHQGLSKQFAAHTVKRAYLALTRGAPLPREGRIETRIARSPHDRKKQAVPRNPESMMGRHAITNYQCLSVYGQQKGQPIGTPAAALVSCRLETGRTHQIRVHLAHIGCPVLDDPVYGRHRGYRALRHADGETAPSIKRQALHAFQLGFIHPVTKQELHFETPLPPDMQSLLDFMQKL
ncbi:Ribosomal large subunit pseudouridine synthase D [hydrothermal vent metagenome]|uniref:Ribosomal large subunit pseudouridine synthase D n=1 Tax=hydrothermal vent metagenome TaxID=652676 RepID=A0A3B0RC65_9ZZZZ